MNDTLVQFLNKAGWAGSQVTMFPADWSSRSYARVRRPDGMTAIVLISPPDESPDSVVGHKIGEWVRLNGHFSAIGVHVPEIYAQDLSEAFVLMEDFGSENIAEKGADAYLAATDVLIQMRDRKGARDADLIEYEKTHVYKALQFFPNFLLKNKSLTDEWFAVWSEVEQAAPECPRALTHIDFGAANLMWLPDNAGADRVGVLDFQAACDGPFAYDMVNLLEDARRVISGDIKQACIQRYCAALSSDDRHAFDVWFQILAAQFHARVLGQIIKLKEAQGRDDLMQFYDQLWRRFMAGLDYSSLRPVQDFVLKYSEVR